MADVLERLRTALADRYRIEHVVGKGGMATVLLAEDLKHHRQVAIKVIGLAGDVALGSARFLQEIRLTARLAHPNVLPLFDSGNVDELLFYVMPYVGGESLRQMLTRGVLSTEEALRVIREVGDALEYAHRQNVIHRDIKPENILFQQNHAVIADFGVARALITAAGNETTLSPLTATGTTVGTPMYMSPEQITGTPIDERSDQYSFACVIYEMVAGEPPFSGPAVHSVLYQHVNVDAPTLGSRCRNVPPAFDRAVARALSKKREDRFATVSEFVTALSQTPAIAAPSPVDPAQAPTIRSIAVLPLENLSGESEQEYFADGMTGALIATMGKIRALRVISRTSVMTYKGARKPLPVIARELNVEAVVEGTVWSVGDQVRITVELISAHDDVLLWSETFERDLRDVLTLQTELVKSIAAAIHVKLSGGEKKQLTDARQVEPDVYRLELMGQEAIATRTTAGFKAATNYFRKAAAIDPTYAPAHAGLSYALLISTNYGIESPAESYQAARAAAERAIQLDPMLHDGHLTLGIVRWQYEWNWNDAGRLFRRAIDLNPGSANAAHWHSFVLGTAGRLDDAITESQRARTLDPLSHIIHTGSGWLRVWHHREQEAVLDFQQVLDAEPNYVPALFYLGLALARLGRAREGVDALERAVQDSGRLARALAYLSFVAAEAGDLDRACAVRDELHARQRSDYVPPYFLAIAEAAVGNMNGAVEWMERGFTDRDVMLRDLAVDPACDSLRRDARCIDIMRRMSIPTRE